MDRAAAISSGSICRSCGLSLVRSVVSETLVYWASLVSIEESELRAEVSAPFGGSARQDIRASQPERTSVRNVRWIMLGRLPPFQLPLPGSMPLCPPGPWMGLGLQVALALEP